MNLRDLEYFVTIAATRQIRMAAEQIGITQPALTKSLIRLEKHVDTKLFYRTSKGMQLTQAGSLLLNRAKGILLKVDDTKREIKDAATGLTGHLRIGAGPSLTESLLPHVASSLLAHTTGITLKIITALNDGLFEELRAGRIDLVISGIPERPPDDFEQELLYHDAIVFVSSKNHPLANRKAIPLKDLAGAKWVLPPENALARRWLEQAFGTRKLPAPSPMAEADSAAAILAIVANTQLIGFQPRSNLKALSAGKRVQELAITSGHWHRPVGVTVRRNEYLPPVFHVFMTALKEAVKHLEKNELSE